MVEEAVNSINLSSVSRDIIREARSMIHLVSVDYIKKDKIHFVVGFSKKHSVYFFSKGKKWSCDCPYFSISGKYCKHIIAAYLFLKYLKEKRL